MKKIILAVLVLIVAFAGYKGLAYYGVYKVYEGFDDLDNEIMYKVPEEIVLSSDLEPEYNGSVEYHNIEMTIPKSFLAKDNDSDSDNLFLTFGEESKVWIGEGLPSDVGFDGALKAFLATPNDLSFFDSNSEILEEHILLMLKWEMMVGMVDQAEWYVFDTGVIRGFYYAGEEDFVAEFFSYDDESYKIASMDGGLTREEFEWVVGGVGM